VNVGTTSIQSTHLDNAIQLFFAQEDQSINIKNRDQQLVQNLKIYSITGQLVESWEKVESKTYLENKLSPGIYILECEINHTPIRNKINID
jgi:hypothetical protein